MSLINIHKFVCTPSRLIKKYLPELTWEQQQLKDLKVVLRQDIMFLTQKRNKIGSAIVSERRFFRDFVGNYNFKKLEGRKRKQVMEKFSTTVDPTLAEYIEDLHRDLLETQNKLQSLQKEEKLLNEDIADIETLL